MTLTRVPSLLDRCDSDDTGAEAGVVYILLTEDPASAIVLCGHHFDKHEKAILARNPYLVQDSRESVS
jgi:hypothetical protein